MPRKPKSWDHAISRDPRGEIIQCQSCTRGLRDEVQRQATPMAGWIGSYRYDSGRAGRVSTRRIYLCRGCAEFWCRKHKLYWPAPPPGTRSPAVSKVIRAAAEGFKASEEVR